MIKIKQAKNLSIFANFKRRGLQQILKNSFTRSLVEKENLFSEGERRDVFFVVLAGQIAILRQLGQVTQPIEIVAPGEFIAERALCDPKSKHSHTAKCCSKQAQLLGLPGKLFRKWPADLKSKLLLNLLPIISDNFSHASNRIMTLFQIGQILGNKNLSIEKLGNKILKTLLKAIRANKALVALKETDPQKLKIIATYGFSPKKDIANSIIQLKDEDLIAPILNQGKQINIKESEYVLRKDKVNYIESCLLGVPLQIGEQTIGAILLIDKKNRDGFSTNNEVLLNIIAQMIGLAFYQLKQLEIKEAEQELKREYISM